MKNRYVIVVSILALVVGCTVQEDPHAGLETGVDNAVVDAVFAEWDVPGSPGCAVAVAEDGALMVRIEQEPPLAVVPVTVDWFEIEFQPDGWSGSNTITLEFDRNRAGAVKGFGLSMRQERGIVFEKGESR